MYLCSGEVGRGHEFHPFLKCFRSSEIILMLLLNWVDIKWGLFVFLLPMIVKS